MNYKDYCPERYTEIENYELAKADNFKGWECHHRLGEHCFTTEELMKYGLYFDRTPAELIFLTTGDHSIIHHRLDKAVSIAQKVNTGRKNTPEQIRRISAATKEAMKDVPYDKLAFWKDKKQSEEHKLKRTLKTRERAEAYRKYKVEGGELMFNDFQKTFFPRKSRGKTRPSA